MIEVKKGSEPEDGRDVGQGLDYQNLFAVCHGNTKIHKRGVRRISSKDDLTCDKHRGNMAFRKINPCRKETLQTIFYTLDGKIHAEDADVHFDLVDTLHLNCNSSPVVSERKAALDGLMEEIGMVDEEHLHSYCTKTLTSFTNEHDFKTPYVGILIWYLVNGRKSIPCIIK